MAQGRSIRLPLTHHTANLAATGFPFQGEGLRQGYLLDEPQTGRQFRFCKLNPMGTQISTGKPLSLVSSGITGGSAQNIWCVTADLSDGAGSAGVAGNKFAGIALAKQGSTGTATSAFYGWIMTKGPIGKIPGSMLSTLNLNVIITTKTASVTAGQAFTICAAVDGKFVNISTSSVQFRKHPCFVSLDRFSAARLSAQWGYITNLLD